MPNAPFPIDPYLTAIALAYRNKHLIADEVLPRVPVAKQEFKYRKFKAEEGFTIPDTKVGRTSRPNQVEFGFEEVASFTRDYALDDPVPYADIENAPDGYDPVAHATESLTALIALDREVRSAKLVFDPAKYNTAYKVTLTGDDQWSDFDNSNPISAIIDALDACIMRPNIAVLGQAVWTKLSQHPKVVSACYGNTGDRGIATREAFAALLELDAIYVGQAWVNITKKGQTPTIAKAWGKHAAFIYRDTLGATAGTTFGFTAQWGDRVAGRIEDPNIGMRGGVITRVGESVGEVICAGDLGYLFQDAVA